jgi:hypothetical protein
VPGLLSPGIALTRVSPTKNRRRCSSSWACRSAGLASTSGAVGSNPSTHPAIITTGELSPLLLCKLMIRTCVNTLATIPENQEVQIEPFTHPAFFQKPPSGTSPRCFPAFGTRFGTHHDTHALRPFVGCGSSIMSLDASSCSKAAAGLPTSTSIFGFGPRVQRMYDVAHFVPLGPFRCRRSP